MDGDRFAPSARPVMKTHYEGCRRVVLVLHATYPDARDKMEARLRAAFADLGVKQVESLHHSNAAGQAALLENADGIFVGGGETFVLLEELYRLHQIEIIRRRVQAGVPYGGSSAGANVAGLLIGTTNDFPVADIPSREALAIFPAAINPHHPLPNAKAEFEGRVGKIKTYLQFNPDESVLALANTSIAVLRDGVATLVTGRGWTYSHAGVRTLAVGDRIFASPKS